MFSKNRKESRFNVGSLEQQGSGMVTVITDEQTGVKYLLALVPNMGSGMTVLVDESGKPLVVEKS